MKTLSRFLCIFVILIGLAACGAPPATAPVIAPTAVPTEKPVAPTPAPTEMLMPTVVPTSVPMTMEAKPFDVSVAQYFLDSAGFHGMAETLVDTKTIDATYFSTVNRVKKVLAQTVWPAELNEQAQAFIESLGSFAAALEADDVAEAVETSEAVHDAQHELSHSIDHWMGEAMATTTAAEPFDVSVAQYFLDSAGFHGMAETLADSKAIDPTYLSTVNRVKKVLVQTVWPTELNDQAQAFIKSLGDFAAALEANDVAKAVELSERVHDAQHELSHAIDRWMETAQPISTDADPFKVSVAQYFLDSAGFHGMAETLADTKTVDPTYLSTVNRVKKVLAQTVWPAELNEQAQAFITSLGDFATALSDNKVDDAIAASDTVHDAQHELSHAIDSWAGADAHNH
jgi:archaellum biogenesis ATPase FlaH